MSAFNCFATHLWRGAHGYDRMKVYCCNNFEGYYPVGAAAIVVAANESSARDSLATHLSSIGLPQDASLLEIAEVDVSHPGVHILNDGNY